jgi:hypothetical protein
MGNCDYNFQRPSLKKRSIDALSQESGRINRADGASPMASTLSGMAELNSRFGDSHDS